MSAALAIICHFIKPIDLGYSYYMNERMTGKTTLRFAAALAAGGAMAVLLASCTAPRHPAKQAAMTDRGTMSLVSQPPGSYVQCVPYARDFSGIQIYGDAWTWWAKADGRYGRGDAPKHGAVLTLKKTNRLAAGHVAVVAAVVEPRRILVDHANWGDNADMRSKIHLRQPVIDVSRDNDWSAVRFMNGQGSFGAVYPAFGFIYSDTNIRTAQNEPRPKR